MSEGLLLNNEYIQLMTDGRLVYLLVRQIGCSLLDFQEEISRMPRVKITKFIALKEELARGGMRPVIIGEYKPLVEIDVSKDRLKAYARINHTSHEYREHERGYYLDEIMEAVKQQGIIFGYEWSEIMERIAPGVPILIAAGKVPINGNDAKITLYAFKEKKPELSERGNANFYEMNLINSVDTGEWIGERIEPTEGIPGRTVFGEIIPAQKGQQIKLNFDPASVTTVFDPEKNVTTLHAKFQGAVELDKGRLRVSHFLSIPDSVSFETGNITFDGCIEIRNTVQDNFSVVATKDIQIMGPLGIGGVDLIESRDGSIYIKGGIFGKDKAKIVCKGNLYTKFASNCTIECDGIVNIGFYAMNCDIRAKEIIFESSNSKLIGGHTNAVYKVQAGEIGSPTGCRTYIGIEGFKRSDVKKEYDLLENALERLKEKIDLVKKRLTLYAGAQLNETNQRVFDLLMEEQDKLKRTLKVVTEEKAKCLIYLKTKGEGEVSAIRRIYGNVVLQMAGETKIVENPINLPMRFYLSGGRISS